MPEHDPRPESQTLRGCNESQRNCQDRFESILASHRSEQRAVNGEVFRKLDAIRDRLPGDTAAAEAVSGPGMWRTVGLPVVLALIIAVTSAAVMGGLSAYFATPAKAAPEGP